MEIKRIYNNNVVVAVNGADGPEMIAIGKGLAFQKKPGDSIGGLRRGTGSSC